EEGGAHGLEGFGVGVVEGACGGEDAAEHGGLARLHLVGPLEGAERFAGVAGVVVGDAEVVERAVVAGGQFGSAAELVDSADEVALLGVEDAEVMAGAPVIVCGG